MSYIVALLENNQIDIWNVDSNKFIGTIVNSDEDEITCISISNDGKWVALGHISGIVTIWKLSRTKLYYTLDDHKKAVSVMKFAFDNEILLTADFDGEIRIWNKDNLLFVLSGHKYVVRSLAISSDSQQIISGDDDGMICYWNAITGKLCHCFRAHESAVFCVIFFGDDKKFVSGGSDRLIKIWDTNSELLKTLDNKAEVYCLLIQDDYRLIPGGYGCINIWDIESAQLLKTFSDPEAYICTVILSADEKEITSCDIDNKINFWKC
jgi:WD40 repeat protein